MSGLELRRCEAERDGGHLLGAAKNQPTLEPRPADPGVFFMRYGCRGTSVSCRKRAWIPLTVTEVTRMALHMLMTPPEPRIFFRILVPPISPEMTNAFVIAHLPKNCVRMMLATIAPTAAGSSMASALPDTPRVLTTAKKTKVKSPPTMAKIRRPQWSYMMI